MVGNPEVMPQIFRKIQAAAVGRTVRSVPVLSQFAEPDVAVADWVIVVLQGERQLLGTGGVRRPHVVAGGAGQLDVVLDQHAVVKRGDVRGPQEFSGGVETRAVENDVVPAAT